MQTNPSKGIARTFLQRKITHKNTKKKKNRLKRKGVQRKENNYITHSLFNKLRKKKKGRVQKKSKLVYKGGLYHLKIQKKTHPLTPLIRLSYEHSSTASLSCKFGG
jgi:hypothetical protein